jgi:AraC-like DNA-binding protein
VNLLLSPNPLLLKLPLRKLPEYRQKLHDLFKDDRATDLLGESNMAIDDKIFLIKFVQIIEEKLDDPQLNAFFIEKTFSISKMQLYRKLTAITGMTPGEFIKNIRLKYAAQLLVSTNLTVSEIFYRTGFNNQSYFFREFKKRYDCPPNEYKRNKLSEACHSFI